ncbi:MAG: cytochrome c, partial [Anaerolineae bacterium]
MNRNTGRDGTPSAAGRRLFDLRPWLALLTTAGLLLALASWLLLSTPAAAAPPAQETPPLPADARAGLPIYLEKCAPCHGETGMGNGPQAAQLQFPPAQFADTAAMWGRTPADLFAVTKNGRIERFMPPFAQSTSDQNLWNVLAYVWSLHLDPAELQQGEAVYQAACAGCHGAAGKGDGPDAGADLLDLTSLDATANRSQRDWFDSLQSSAHSRVADLSDAERWASLEFVRTWT